MYFKSLFTLSSLLAAAAAHGVVGQIDVSGGQSFQGPLAGQTKESPIWSVSTSSPVTDLSSGDLFCGPSGASSGQSPSIGAGSTLTFTWISGYDSSYAQEWPHNTGPIMTYLAACNGDCNSASDNLNFFKISELGMEDGVWVQEKVHQGQSTSAQIPSDLKPGNYLVRHEIIGLHASPAEFYPSCSSWTITGSGNNDYSSYATNNFPGTYSYSDPGIADTASDVYNVQSNSDYTFPGGDVIQEGNGGSSSAQPTSSTASNSSKATSSTSQTLSVASTPSPSVPANAQYNAAAEVTPSSSSSSSSEVQSASTSSEVSQQPKTTSSSFSSSAPSATSTCSTKTEDECEKKWSECNNNWTPGTDYTCQTEFSNCRGQSVRRALRNQNKRSMMRKVKRHTRNHH